MPVFRSGKGLAPSWCELEYFEIVRLPVGATHTFERLGCKEKLIVGEGSCRIDFAGNTVARDEGANLDLKNADGHFEVLDVAFPATLIRMCGRWGEETGGSGLFTVTAAYAADGLGDPVDYPKDIAFDSHYHDSDEYWIIYEGQGVAVSEGKLYEVGPGDCVATRAGDHHDFPRLFEPVKAVYFETTLVGQKRPGHLWDYRHGPAQPR